MYLEITDKRKHDDFFEFCNPWSKEGFFVATVGEAAVGYLDRKIFDFYELSCCSKLTLVNMVCFSDYKRWIDDDDKAKKQCNADTEVIAEKCRKKQLYVLSEIDDIYAANQCCTLARSNGEEGLSVLITHRKINDSEHFREVKDVFDLVIFLPDDAKYITDVLRWIMCGFTQAGWIGVDYEDARYVLTRSKEAFCRKIKYDNAIEMRSGLSTLIEQVLTTYDKEKINSLLGIWVPRDFDIEDLAYLIDKTCHKSYEGEVIVSCLDNEKDDDESWTVILLSGSANKMTTE